MDSFRRSTYAHVQGGLSGHLYRVSLGLTAPAEIVFPTYNSFPTFEEFEVGMLPEDRCFEIGAETNPGTGWAERHMIGAAALHEDKIDADSAMWISRLSEGLTILRTESKGGGAYDCYISIPHTEVSEEEDADGLIELTRFGLTEDFYDDTNPALNITYPDRSTLILPLAEGALERTLFQEFRGFGGDIGVADRIVIADLARKQIRLFDYEGLKCPMDIDARWAVKKYLTQIGVVSDDLSHFSDLNFPGSNLRIDTQRVGETFWARTVVSIGNHINIGMIEQ